MIGDFCSINGKLVPSADAKVHIDNLEYAYGFGVYESIKVRDRLLYFPEMHLERLLASAQIIGLDHHLDIEKIKDSLDELVKSVPQPSFNVKMMLVGREQEGDLYIFASMPHFVQRKAYRDGVKVITLDGERQFHHAKTLNMLMSYLAYRTARKKDAHDALLIDREGFIREGTRTNIFYTDGKTIFTPPTTQVLDGVTRRTVIESLEKSGIPVAERMLKADEVKTYHGFFLTSTSVNVLPISQIDDQVFAVPELVKTAIKIYSQYLSQY